MKKYNKSYRIFQVFNYIFLLIIGFFTLYPFIYTLSLSFSSTKAILSQQVSFFPVDFTVNAYQLVLENQMFWVGYRNTILYTVLGTLIALFMTVICAYPLSKKGLRGKKFFTAFIVFTMFFNGGLIPTFLVIRMLGMMDTIWSIVVPGAIGVYYMIIIRTYFQSLPPSLEEAAMIDGLNYIQILYKIILPLSKPMLATIGLFYAVYFWNNWFYPMIFLNDSSLYPVTLYLRNIVMGMELAARSGEMRNQTAMRTTGVSVRSASIMLVAIPIMCIYPFVQKYFIKGLMIGSLKG